MDLSALSPMMRQYMGIKKQNPDGILFYRLGDFYEMFFDDALVASKELELVLTGRECGLEERAPMCGVPHHSAESYIARLIAKGYKVAVCEQVEDPKTAKGIVERQVVRVITPGTLTEESMLDEARNNFMVSICCQGLLLGLAAADISTGHVQAAQFDDTDTLKNELLCFAPSELVVGCGYREENPTLAQFLEENFAGRISTADSNCADEEKSKTIDLRLGELLGGCEAASESPAMAAAVKNLIGYIYDTHPGAVGRMGRAQVYEAKQFMILDATARRNLELVRTMRTDEKRGSLLWSIDRTKTAMGRRLLRRDLERPLANPVAIEGRLNAAEELVQSGMRRLDLVEALSKIPDMQRLFTRIACKSTTPREMLGFAMALGQLPGLKRILKNSSSRLLTDVEEQIDPMQDIEHDITRCLADNPPATQKEGWFVREGFDDELDALRRLQSDTKSALAEIESRERQQTGIKNLRIGFNKIFGYYLEVTNSNKDMVPDHYIRKQTLVGSERYITEGLKQLEEQILSARERSVQIEISIFERLQTKVAENAHRVQKSSDAVARLDVLCSHAVLALERDYSRPAISVDGVIEIVDGRHPVVEALCLGDERFVPNDCLLDLNQNRIAIITGPNMAGKSTFIRQVALIVLLAQAGSFVPASFARIGLVDGIFTRIGASDDLSTGQSTFMVEMNEVANILKNATSKSLLILDEVGRGTSTFDGMSIARAMLEYIADRRKLGAKTLFATHYHELTDLQEQLDCVKNYNTAVKKRGDEITFLRRILPGAVDDSYGIEVSKLAGIPDWIIKRAFEVLEDLEKSRPVENKKKKPVQDVPQLVFAKTSKVEQAISGLELDALTPLDALNKMYELKAMLPNR